MKKIAILVLENSVMQAIADPQYCFSAVNQFSLNAKQEIPFELALIGLNSEVSLNAGQFIVKTDRTIDHPAQYDLLIIPAIFGDIDTALQANKAFIPWIINQYEHGAELASLCLGAFVLASTNLLDQHKCSTHWNFSEEFNKRFPLVKLQTGEIITEENRIYTSGGANSYWNLLLHLVEKYTNREIAILTSKYFAIDFDRNSQSVFTLFKGQKSHRDNEIMSIQNYIENNVYAKFNIDDLAAKVSLSRRSLERRFKSSTQNSILEYIQRVKMEAAKRSFESTRKNINEVMLELGYNDSKAFRTIFKKITGLTPIDYRNKYNKQVKLAV
jgi:transcriptional regulator GlxA family with amidase domain